jgi:hypothetical protein
MKGLPLSRTIGKFGASLTSSWLICPGAWCAAAALPA